MRSTKKAPEHLLEFQIAGACGRIRINPNRRVLLRNLVVEYAGQRMMFAATSALVRGHVIHLLVENKLQFAY